MRSQQEKDKDRNVASWKRAVLLAKVCEILDAEGHTFTFAVADFSFAHPFPLQGEMTIRYLDGTTVHLLISQDMSGSRHYATVSDRIRAYVGKDRKQVQETKAHNGPDPRKVVDLLLKDAERQRKEQDRFDQKQALEERVNDLYNKTLRYYPSLAPFLRVMPDGLQLQVFIPVDTPEANLQSGFAALWATGALQHLVAK